MWRTAALANLNILEREHLVANAKTAGTALKAALKRAFGDHPLVGDIRGEGLMLGIELVADKATKLPFDPALKLTVRIVAFDYDEGVIVRPLTNVIAISPPLTLSAEDIEVLVAGLRRAFDRMLNAL